MRLSFFLVFLVGCCVDFRVHRCVGVTPHHMSEVPTVIVPDGRRDLADIGASFSGPEPST